MGVSGSSADLNGAPGVNLLTAHGNGKVRIEGPLAGLLRLKGREIVIKGSGIPSLVIGELLEAPTCNVMIDAGEFATPSWNEIRIASHIRLTLDTTDGYTLSITDELTQRVYQYSW